MCSPQNQTLINNVLDDYVSQGRAFTAFEVSIEAKKRGATERHRDMRAYIHSCQSLNDELEFGSYSKTLVPVGGGNNAFLYHPNSFDPANYVPLDTNQSPAPTQPNSVSAPATSAAAATPTVDDGDIGHSLDHRNRLMIPTSFIRGLGVDPGNRVNVVRNNGSIFLIPEANAVADGDTATQQVVERNGDLRLSLGTLMSASLQTGNFQIESSSYNNSNAAIEVYNIDSDGNRL